MKKGNFSKIELQSLLVVKNYMKPKDLKKALAIVTEYNQEFEKAWDEYFNQG